MPAFVLLASHRSTNLQVDRILALMFLSLTLVMAPDPRQASATTYTRTTGPGLFRQASLWGLYFPPAYFGPGTAADVVKFDLGTSLVSPYTVTNVSGENSRLLVGYDALTLNILQYSLINNSAIDQSLTLGLASGDRAYLELVGTAASQLQSKSMSIAAANNSFADLVVRGIQWSSSGLARIGDRGFGTLSIYDGAQVTKSGQLWAGYSPGSNGQINVEGPSTSYSVSSEIILGDSGSGFLRVADGSQFSSFGGQIGHFPNSHGTATITGANSTWTSSSDTVVGVHGTGSMYLDSGGQVTSSRSAVGVYHDGLGAVVVSKPGSVWTTTDTLSIGGDSSIGESQGHGSVTVLQDGRIVAGGTTTVYAGGTLHLQGGSFSSPTIDFQGGAFNWTGGALSIGVYNGNLTNGGGVLAPGNATGSTTIAGNYVQLAGGALAVDLGGTAAGSTYDSVGVTGSAILGGELQLNLANGFVPHGADSFSILNAVGGVLSVFNNVGPGQRLTLDNGAGSFLVNYGVTSAFNPNQVVLSSFLPTFTADFDLDGDVDGDDLQVWENASGVSALADADGDSDSDGRDFLAWQRQYGSGVRPIIAALGAVPEPTSFAIALANLLTMLAQRPHRSTPNDARSVG